MPGLIDPTGTLRARAADVQVRPLADDEVLVPRTWLDAVLVEDAGAVESRVLPALLDLVAAHVEARGWFMPPPSDDVAGVLLSVRRSAARLAGMRDLPGNAHAGSAAIKGWFPSFWHVQGGPAEAARDRAKLTRVLRYRLGLNTRRETFDVTLAEIRRGFVVSGHAPSFFKPAVAAALYARYCPGDAPRVWDPSGGFGARMLGFFAMFPGGTYVCNEPAAATRADLIRLGERLAPHRASRAAAHVLPVGSEIAGPDDPVDLVFTSPPYFDRERYYDEPGQCWRDYPTREEWVEGYLIPTLTRAEAALRPGGHVVLNVHAPLRGLVVAAAGRVGLTLADELALVLQRGALQRRHGVTQEHHEPILVFRRTTGGAAAPDADAERWEPVEGTGGRYDVSTRGRVRSRTRGTLTILTGTVQASGYRAVGITRTKGGRTRTELVHRLVARAFLGEPPSEAHTDVRHLDGDKRNNRVSNLAWGTRSENMLDVVRHRRSHLVGAFPPHADPSAKSRPWYSGRTTDEGLVQTCLRLLDAGEITLRVMGRILDCSEDVAANIAAGRTHRAVVKAKRTPASRRSKARVAQILALIEEGRSREEVNAALDETLNHQAFYYYKAKLSP